MIATHQPIWWNAAITHLQKDKKLDTVIQQEKNCPSLQVGGDAFTKLIKSITGQQVSIHAAEAVFNRLQKSVGEITPKSLKNMSIDQIKSVGYSKQKASYLLNISEAFIKNNWSSEKLFSENYEKMHTELLQIKGIGLWTIEMFAIFFRGEKDVFPLQDLGIIKAVRKLYCVSKEESTEIIKDIAKNWQPYRTAATWYLWRFLDSKPINY